MGAYKGAGHGETLTGMCVDEMAMAPQIPPQRTLGGSPNVRPDKRIKRLTADVLVNVRRLAAPAGTPNSPRKVRFLPVFLETTSNGRPCDPRDLRNQGRAKKWPRGGVSLATNSRRHVSP